MTPFQPFDHQVRARDIARQRNRYAFYFEPGCGKTLATLMICADKGGRTCIVAPKSVARTAWTDDTRTFYPSLKVAVAAGESAPKRRAAIAGDADLLIINPESFWRHEKEIVGKFDRLVIDESSKAKNPKAKFTQAAIRISDHMRDVYLLSGTPAPNGEHEYWPQMRMLDSALFGLSYYRFLGEYFTPIQKRYGTETHTVGQEMKDHKRAMFTHKLASVSWHLKKTDCLDLPEQTDITRIVELATDEKRAYKDAKKNAILELDGNVEQIRAQAVGMKLQQLCGGWAYVNDSTVRYGSSKLSELCDLLEEIGDEQVVIWANFRHDIDRIIEATGATNIDARTSHKSGEIVSAFQSGMVRRLVCHPKAAGHGITMTAASHAVYYSLPWSAEEYQQSRDRIHRAGQKRACTYWHLLADGTIDHQVYKVVRGKVKAQAAVLEALQK